ncbi:molybdopterin-dependent oxidoreductase [Rhodococcus hoagii]|nr:molybdopterin-dependent oxidoreductase [Prescottella equi]
MTLLHSSGLGTSFGRGGATNYQQDLVNADCIIIQGSNMAECHPVGFQWVMEAKLRGAKVIHVDPRFTRTSAVADLHVRSAPARTSRSWVGSSTTCWPTTRTSTTTSWRTRTRR